MKARRCTFAPLAALFLLAGPAPADPPPPRAQLQKLLQREPINLASWPAWSKRLREWSGEHAQAADPAFQRAFGFLKKVQSFKGDRPVLPRELDRDAVAWALTAGLYLGDAKSPFGRVGAARFAEKAARRSVQLDGSLARGHYVLYRALYQQQLTPSKDGGPQKPDRGRLAEALRHLREARALDPKGPHWMYDGWAWRVATDAGKWGEAELYLREALDRRPDDVQLARRLAGVIPEQGQPRREPYAASLRPLVERFPGDGVIASHHARALHQDRKPDEARAELLRARQLGVDPGQYIGANRARDIAQGPRQARGHGGPLGDLVSTPVSWARTVGWWAMWFAIVYGTLMLLMCVGGLVLARYTRGPRAAGMLGTPAEAVSPGGQVTRTRGESRLTKFYAFALLLALVLFYLSLPFVFLGLLIVFLLVLVLALFMYRDRDTADVHVALMRASGGGIGAVF
jgi:tetratricopeptide (TPR) repeat protein